MTERLIGRTSCRRRDDEGGKCQGVHRRGMQTVDMDRRLADGRICSYGEESRGVGKTQGSGLRDEKSCEAEEPNEVALRVLHVVLFCFWLDVVVV